MMSTNVLFHMSFACIERTCKVGEDVESTPSSHNIPNPVQSNLIYKWQKFHFNASQDHNLDNIYQCQGH